MKYLLALGIALLLSSAAQAQVVYGPPTLQGFKPVTIQQPVYGPPQPIGYWASGYSYHKGLLFRCRTYVKPIKVYIPYAPQPQPHQQPQLYRPRQ